MKLFRLFKRERAEELTPEHQIQRHAVWEEIPLYIPLLPEEYGLVPIIATAIAAGDRPERKFTIKKILQHNPEANLVSIIASSIAAENYPESKFTVKKILKRKEV